MFRPSTKIVTGPRNAPFLRAAKGAGAPVSLGGTARPAISSLATGGAAAASPVVQLETYEAYLSELGASNATTQATLGALIFFFADQAISDPTGKYAALFMTGAAKTVNDMIEFGVDPPVNSNDSLIQLVKGNANDAPGWALNLMLAAKKKPLEGSNVDGFFASLGHTGTNGNTIAKMINLVAPFFPDEILDKDIRDLQVDNQWTEYRNTRISTGGIIRQNIDFLIQLEIIPKDGQVHKDILSAAENPWDLKLANAIPEKIKAYVCIFLEASGNPIDKWYQGNRARDSLPAVRIKGAKEIFKRYLAIVNDVEGLDAVDDLAGLVVDGGIAKTFFSSN